MNSLTSTVNSTHPHWRVVVCVLGYDTLPEEVEEGLCELSAYTWLTHMVNSKSEHQYQLHVLQGLCEHMERDSSPVYGVGFHAAAAALHGRELGQLLSYVGAYKVFPPFHYSDEMQTHRNLSLIHISEPTRPY
eukprot:TRINITY_DN20485_c0_g1_i1.p1 TRINITY_DN20485_c0_g1~~TRINITY_DN20485_c0_g1_i1.p1  ORF type:complete len:133 (-),score=29.82 TRINITY_DN20485_c0_g1_i1:17-415(-)